MNKPSKAMTLAPKVAKRQIVIPDYYETKRAQTAQGNLYRSISRTLSQSDSMLAGRSIKVIATPFVRHFHTLWSPTRHWTEASPKSSRRRAARGEEPTRVFEMVGPEKGTTDEQLNALISRNYHSLAHYLFGIDTGRLPLNSSFLGTGSYWGHGNREAQRLCEFLECARVERLMMAAFPATRPYLMRQAYERAQFYFDAKNPLTAYLYFAARPHFAGSLRLTLRKRLSLPQAFPSDAEIVASFRGFLNKSFKDTSDGRSDFVASANRALAPIFGSTAMHSYPDTFKRSVHYLRYSFPNDVPMCEFDTSTSQLHGTDSSQKDAEAHEQAQSQAQEQAAQDEAQGNRGGQSQSQSQSQSESESESQGQGQDDSEREEQSSNDGQSAIAGTGSGDHSGSPSSPEEEFEQALDELRSAQASDPKMRSEIQALRDVARNAGKYMSQAATTQHLIPSSEAILLARSMGREFAKIVEDEDPGFTTHQSSGRINMSRAMHGADPETAFDIWEEGNTEAASIEACVLVDFSGSMGGHVKGAFTAAWAIARSIESLGSASQVTTFAFDNNNMLIKAGSVKARPDSVPYLDASGGTEPSVSLADSAFIFRESKRKHKALFILTDGVWSSRERNDDLIKMLRSNGVYVSLAYLSRLGFDDSTEDYYRAVGHGADSFHLINRPSAFATLAKDTVKGLMRR